MAALSGGEMCIKYLMFAFNLVFWVSLEREKTKCSHGQTHIVRVCVRV